MIKKKRTQKILVGIAAFLIFIMLFFPSNLVKDVVVNQLQLALQENHQSLSIEMESLHSYWFTGVQFKNVKISDQQGLVNPIALDKISVRLSVLPLFIGRLNFNAVVQEKEGSIETFVSLPLISTFLGSASLKSMQIEFSRFPIDDLFLQMRSSFGKKQDMITAFIYPVISKAVMSGKLTGEINYEDLGNKKNGVLDIKLQDGYLNINNQDLNIPTQNFSDGRVYLVWNGSTIQVKKETRIKSQNLLLEAKGVFDHSNGMQAPWQSNLNLVLRLSGQMEKNFGFLIPQVLKCPGNAFVNGSMNVQLIGPVDSLVCQ